MIPKALCNRAPRAARARRHARAQRRRAAVRAGARRAVPCWPALARLGGRIRVRTRSSALPREAHAARARPAHRHARETQTHILFI